MIYLSLSSRSSAEEGCVNPGNSPDIDIDMIIKKNQASGKLYLTDSLSKFNFLLEV